jgi:hypothetical protein
MASCHSGLPGPAKEVSDNLGNYDLANNHDHSNTISKTVSSAAENSYNDSPRSASTMGIQSGSLTPTPEFFICDVCVDTTCDRMFPPCCDTVGSTDIASIPDLDLCDKDISCFQRLYFCLFFEYGKISKLCPWFCAPYDRIFGWSKVSDAVVDFFKLWGNPELFNVACIASCVPYFALCYLIYIPLWLPCYACFALSQLFRKVRSSIKSRTCRFITNAAYLLASGIGISFREFANKACYGRTCFGCRKGCGPECSQLHRGGRYYTNFGLKNDGYDEYCFVCDRSWDSHAGNTFHWCPL